MGFFLAAGPEQELSYHAQFSPASGSCKKTYGTTGLLLSQT